MRLAGNSNSTNFHINNINSTTRDLIWANLRKAYLSYTQGRQTITLGQLEIILKQLLGQHTQTQRDYVTKNWFRIDTDSNGSIDFTQFGNFILKRHCGQISLQRMHSNDEIKRSKERKISLGEFIALLKRAYGFLEIQIPILQAQRLFKEADSDVDGYITYVQYLWIIEQYTNKKSTASNNFSTSTKPNYQHKKNNDINNLQQLKQVKSRFRRFIWEELLQLYNYYDKDHNQYLDQNQIRNLVYNILKSTTTKAQADQVVFNSYKLMPGDSGSTSSTFKISYQEFVPFFVLQTGQLALSKLNRDYISMWRKKIQKQDFTNLIRTHFAYLPISRVSQILLGKIFDKIANLSINKTISNTPNSITYQNYLKWLLQFICPPYYYGNDYYITEDDQQLNIGVNLITIINNNFSTKVGSTNNSNINSYQYHQQQNRSNPSLSVLISQCQNILSQISLTVQQKLLRILTLNLQYLISHKYDLNGNKILQKSQLLSLLNEQLKYSGVSIELFLRKLNQFYQRQSTITHTDLTRFLLYLHLKQFLLPQYLRLNRLKLKRLNQEMLNQQQFIKVLEFGTQFAVGFGKLPQQILQNIFKNIDINNSGWITFRQFQDYMSLMFHKFAIIETSQQFDLPGRIWTSLKKIFSLYDTSRAGSLSEKQLQKLLRQRFLMSNSTDIATVFGALIKDIKLRRTSFTQFASFIIYFTSDQILKRYHLQQYVANDKLTLSQFEILIRATFQYSFRNINLESSINNPVNRKRIKQQLNEIYKKIDTDKDGFIKYAQYLRWIDKDIAKIPR